MKAPSMPESAVRSTNFTGASEPDATMVTPPSTPEKEPYLSNSPSAGSTATTASPSTVYSSESASYVAFVPEEEHEAVRRVLLDGDCAPEDEEDAWNAITHAVTALDKAGHELFAVGSYEAAFLRYERALLLKRTSLQKADEVQEGNHSSAIDGDLIRQQEQQQRADVVASVATSINNITYLRQRAGLLSADDSLASYFKSLQMKRETLGPDHLSVGKTLNNIGSVFYLKKEYHPALQAYKEARRIMEANLGSEHGDVGTVVSNIGDVYFALNRNDEALEQYRAALQIRWVSLGPSDVKVARLMQRIAALETGKQPEREGDESESDTDEYLDADRKDAVFKEDILSLQEELEEDMKFFIHVEQEMALNMLKDKLRIFRELRELSKDDSESSVPSMFAMNQGTPVSSFGGSRRTCISSSDRAAEFVPDRPLRRSRSRSEASSKANGARNRRPCATLTSEEREKALSSVQERVARLRGDRNCVSESSGDDLLIMAGAVDLSSSDVKRSLLSSHDATSPVRRFLLSASQGAAHE
jgi:tetratricopeptide (TPR) repeat protein